MLRGNHWKALYQGAIDLKKQYAYLRRLLKCSIKGLFRLDVNKGRVVKGVNFVNLVDAGAVEIASYYNKAMADELVFLDITATSEGRDTMVDVVKNCKTALFLLQ